MNKKDIESHRVVALEMGWDELSSIIVDLEIEKIEFKECLKKSEIQKYDKLLEIYEFEKNVRVEKLSIYVPWQEIN